MEESTVIQLYQFIANYTAYSHLYGHLYGHLNYTGETISQNFLQLLFYKSEQSRNVQAKPRYTLPSLSNPNHTSLSKYQSYFQLFC